jgi:hypothetical protein
MLLGSVALLAATFVVIMTPFTLEAVTRTAVILTLISIVGLRLTAAAVLHMSSRRASAYAVVLAALLVLTQQFGIARSGDGLEWAAVAAGDQSSEGVLLDYDSSGVLLAQRDRLLLIPSNLISRVTISARDTCGVSASFASALGRLPTHTSPSRRRSSPARLTP